MLLLLRYDFKEMFLSSHSWFVSQFEYHIFYYYDNGMEAKFQLLLKRFSVPSISSLTRRGLTSRRAFSYKNLLQISMDRQSPDGD